MAVPARPVSGQPIATPWGDAVHDAIVAIDIQAGTAQQTGNTAEFSVAVTFPRPFAAPPVVVVSIANNPAQSQGYHARSSNVTATGFTMWFEAPSGYGLTLQAAWFAMGPRT